MFLITPTYLLSSYLPSSFTYLSDFVQLVNLAFELKVQHQLGSNCFFGIEEKEFSSTAHITERHSIS